MNVCCSAAIDIFKSIDDVRVIWTNFENQSTHYVFQKYEWQKNYLDTIGAFLGVIPVIVVIKDGDRRPLMLWPLAIRCRGPFRLLVPLGGDVTDYHAPMLAEAAQDIITPAVIERVLTEVRKQVGRYDVVMLDKIPSLIEDLRNPLVGVPGIEPQGRNAHSTRLGSDFETWVKTRRSSGVLKDERRSIRRLGEAALLSPLINVDGPAATAISLALIAQKSRRWRESGQEDLFAKDAYRSFYIRIIQKEVCCKESHVSALRLGDDFIACHLGLIYRGRFYYLMPTFESGSFSRYSPGNLLLLSLLRWSVSRDVAIFDFTVGDESYKSAWCDVTLSLHRYIRACTALGRCYVLAFRLVEDARRVEFLRRLARAFRRQAASALAK